MTMDERVEAAARALTLADGWYSGALLAPMAEARKAYRDKALKAIAAAFPELTGDKPTHWIAPVEPPLEAMEALHLEGLEWDDIRDYLSNSPCKEKAPPTA